MPYTEETAQAVAQALVHWTTTDLLVGIATAVVGCLIAESWRKQVKNAYGSHAARLSVLIASTLAASAGLLITRQGRVNDAYQHARLILDVATTEGPVTVTWTSPGNPACLKQGTQCDPRATFMTINRNPEENAATGKTTKSANTRDFVTVSLDDARRIRQALRNSRQDAAAFSILPGT